MRWIRTRIRTRITTRILTLLAALALLAASGAGSGCATAYRSPVRPFGRGLLPRGVGGSWGGGLIYSDYKAPLTTDFNATPASSLKTGKASTSYLFIPLIVIPLGLDFAFNKASIEEAARNGGIKKVYYADYEFLNVLGIYSSYTTIAYGE